MVAFGRRNGGFIGLLAGLLPVSQALRTSFTVRELEALIRVPIENAGDTDPMPVNIIGLTKQLPEHNFSVPIDHFHNETRYEPHTNGTFNLRYWFDASHYKPGGPVIVLESGETDGAGRLPFLQKGILAKLAEVTGGIGVVKEHRYYGTSMPTPDLSTENLRFLSTEQGIADAVYFAKNIVFPGLEHLDLTAPATPYLAYGGSYPGAYVAFLRKLYPDVYWGAISSSGVTESIYDYWEYFEAHRLFGPQPCMNITQKLTHIADNILIGQNDTSYPSQLKNAFGLGNLTHDQDFASVLASGLRAFQSTNWDPKVTDFSFDEFCSNLTSNSVEYAATADLAAEVGELITAGGYEAEVAELTNPMLNFIGWINETQIAPCKKETADECFGSFNSTFYQQDDISQQWRSWPYQYCTEWGYLQTGSGVPDDQLPMVSRLIDLEYESIICREAFGITSLPDTGLINKHGGFGISYPRLAIVDGEADPWRAATPHALGQPDRASTASEPFFLIDGGVHHWDENGLFPNETTPELPPQPVRDAQALELQFVQEWMAEWRLQKLSQGHQGSQVPLQSN